jgi:Zn-dependent protease/predicted transcriptional regulator
MASSKTKSIELFRVAGVQVEVDYSWLVIFALVLWSLSAGYFPQEYPGQPTLDYWIVGFVATLFFFGSVLLHELSHAAMANRLGDKVDRITLFIFGGIARLSSEPKSADSELKIAGVGPLSSLAIALTFWLISNAIGRPASLWTGVFRYLAFINLALALFNLLPGFPLDGGRLLRAVLWKRWGDLPRATARAAQWGSRIGWGLIVLGALEIFGGALVGGIWLIFIGLFLRGAAASGYQGTVVEQALEHVRVSDIMTREPVTLTPEISVAEAVEHYFLRFGYGGFPVVSDGRVLGVLSLSHVRHCQPQERAHKKVRDIMLALGPGLEIAPQATALEAMHKMNEANSGRLIVLDGGKMAGFITRTGVARIIQMKQQLGAPANVPESTET